MRVVIGFIVPLAIAAPVLAHHSTAMFDRTREVVVLGTVTEFQWTNPHTFVEVDVPAGAAKGHWSIEGGSPRVMEARGWKVRSLKPGDRVSIIISPLRDGSKGGLLKKATLPDGRTLEWSPA